MTEKKKRMALVASRGSLDGVYPSLILATTAASMGWDAGIFFTFYGLNLLHRTRNQKLKVSPLGNPAMPVQMPNLLSILPGMTSATTWMMKSWFKQAQVPNVTEFIRICQELDVKLIACSTTMGAMKIKKEDLIDGIQIAGAASFLDYAAESTVQLFT